MLKVDKEINGLKELEKNIDFINKMARMKKDGKFQDFIKSKVLETVNRISNERMIGGTTNDMAIAKYKASHKIRDEKDGFVLYNDCTIAADTVHPENYPNGEFSIALAFEYGVGIIGTNTDINSKYFKPWEYNVNNYNFGWKFHPEDSEGYQWTAGYMGFQVYRFTAEYVEKNMKSWVNEYFAKESRGVSL